MSASQEHRSPTEIDPRRGWFDELAARVEEVVSRDVFFVATAFLISLWVPSYFLFHSSHTWYLTLVIPAEILTVLMVTLMANHDRRSEQALHRKVDALAQALAAIIDGSGNEDADKHAAELRAAVGLEDRESTDDS